MPVDKWAQYAVPADKWAQYAQPPVSTGVAGAGPMGTPQPNAPSVNMQPSTIGAAVPALRTMGDIGAGALKGAGHTLNSIGSMILPDKLAPYLGLQTPTPQSKAAVFAPTNTAQKIGYGGEQAAEFLIPGGAEEGAMTKLAPYMGKAAPVLKAGLAALGSGAVNATQGGSFGAGALAGGVGSAVGQGLKALAPSIAESALNIRKLDRAYKAPGAIGRAALDETTGFSPSSVAESAQNRLNELNPQLNAAADRASIQPNRIRGLLPAPGQEIPLQSSANVAATPTRTIVLDQPSRATPLGLPAPARDIPMSSHTDIFPDQLPSGQTRIPIDPSTPSNGMGTGQYIGQVPGQRGGAGQVQGVLLRPFQAPIGAGPIPSTLANPSASLNSARAVISSAFDTAQRQGERTTVGQLQPLATHMGETIGGDPIPSNVTPRQLLDLKRGFGSEFVHRWNPDTMQGVKGTAAQAYHQMANEFNNVVPEAQGLNSQISNLIPIAKRAESAELNAPTAQRVMHRLGAHTGALVSGMFGAKEGYDKGGFAGAIGGGTAGVLAPELLASPTAQMFLARGLNSGLNPTALKALVGAGLQLDRSSKQD